MNYTIEKQLKKSPDCKIYYDRQYFLDAAAVDIGTGVKYYSDNSCRNYIFYGYCFDNTCLY